MMVSHDLHAQIPPAREGQQCELHEELWSRLRTSLDRLILGHFHRHILVLDVWPQAQYNQSHIEVVDMRQSFQACGVTRSSKCLHRPVFTTQAMSNSPFHTQPWFLSLNQKSMHARRRLHKRRLSPACDLASKYTWSRVSRRRTSITQHELDSLSTVKTNQLKGGFLFRLHLRRRFTQTNSFHHGSITKNQAEPHKRAELIQRSEQD